MSQNGAKNKDLKLALSALELQVELRERQRFRWSDGPEQTATLLKSAAGSQHPDVKRALEKVTVLFSGRQKEELKKYGVEFSATPAADISNTSMTYRGSKIEKPAPSPEEKSALKDPDSSDHKPKGKRKIVYRGQVKWID